MICVRKFCVFVSIILIYDFDVIVNCVMVVGCFVCFYRRYGFWGNGFYVGYRGCYVMVV